MPPDPLEGRKDFLAATSLIFQTPYHLGLINTSRPKMGTIPAIMVKALDLVQMRLISYTHSFSIRNSFMRNLYWDSQIA